MNSAMHPSINPTFNCLAVKQAAEMGPHSEPLTRQVERRRSHGYVRAHRAHRAGRRPWGTWAKRAPLRRTRRGGRIVMVGESERRRMDHAAIVASVGVLAGVLASMASRF